MNKKIESHFLSQYVVISEFMMPITIAEESCCRKHYFYTVCSFQVKYITNGEKKSFQIIHN